jgi:hypothetical protein
LAADLVADLAISRIRKEQIMATLDDKVIPADKLALTPAEIQTAERVTAAAADPVPPPDAGTTRMAAPMAAAAMTAKWSADDANSPDYRHLSASTAQPDATFTLLPDDIELVIASNRFDPHGKFLGQDASADDVIAIALRGLALGKATEVGSKLEITDAPSVEVTDIRPDHQNYRCLVGFYKRTADVTKRSITLFAGSTVPNPFLMAAYRQKVLDHVPEPFEKCNMLPTGCYVCRVDHHKTIVPALRMADPADLANDGSCTVIRTFNDLTYGIDDFWDLCVPTDNVHCAFATSRVDSFQAAFSSEGCVTVRGLSAPSDQWKEYQDVLRSIGQTRRCDLLLVTGRDLAIAAKLRASGQSATADVVRRELVCLRAGSTGDEVKRLRIKLALPDGNYFGPTVKKALVDEQKRRNEPIDGVYSPALDAKWGWAVFA